jgi:hypothetical protein
VLCALSYKIKFSPHKLFIFVSHFFFRHIYLFLSLFISFLFLFLSSSLSSLSLFISVLFLSFRFLPFLCLSAVGLHIFSKCLFHFNFSHRIGPYVDLLLTAYRFSHSDDNIVEPKWILSIAVFKICGDYG